MAVPTSPPAQRRQPMRAPLGKRQHLLQMLLVIDAINPAPMRRCHQNPSPPPSLMPPKGAHRRPDTSLTRQQLSEHERQQQSTPPMLTHLANPQKRRRLAMLDQAPLTACRPRPKELSDWRSPDRLDPRSPTIPSTARGSRRLRSFRYHEDICSVFVSLNVPISSKIDPL